MSRKRVFKCGSHKTVDRVGQRKKSTFVCRRCKKSSYKNANNLSSQKCDAVKEKYHTDNSRRRDHGSGSFVR